MEWSTAEEILVIILSTALAVFLILGIMALVALNRILKSIRRITDKAERIADNAEQISEFFQKTAGPAAIAKLLSNIVSSIKKRSTGKE
jgi:hypothetical protein